MIAKSSKLRHPIDAVQSVLPGWKFDTVFTDEGTRQQVLVREVGNREFIVGRRMTVNGLRYVAIDNELDAAPTGFESEDLMEVVRYADAQLAQPAA